MNEVYRRVARKGELAQEDHNVCFYVQVAGQEVRILGSDKRVLGYDEQTGELRTNEYLGPPV